MFDFPMLETAIGLCLVFSLFSLLVTAVQELLASLFDSRGRFFTEGIQNLLYLGVPPTQPEKNPPPQPADQGNSENPPKSDDAVESNSQSGSRDLASRVLRNHLVQTLKRGNRDFGPSWSIMKPVVAVSRPFRRWDKKSFMKREHGGKAGLLTVQGPSYMPATMFSEVLLEEVSDMVGRDRSDPRVLPLLRRGIREEETLRESDIGKTLVHLIDRAERRTRDGSGEDELLAEIGAWFDSGMEQVSGWYRRHTRKMVLVLGLALAALFNVDTLRITNELYRNPSLRAEAVAAAEMMNAMPESSDDSTVAAATIRLAQTVDTVNAILVSAGIPMGWTGIALRPPSEAGDQLWLWTHQMILRLIGWLFTAAAVSLGAPFWFDLLKRIVSIRAGSAPPVAGAGTNTRRPGGGAQAGSAQETGGKVIAASGPPLV